MLWSNVDPRQVITGGPNAGKTTLIEALRSRRFHTVNEKATEVIIEGRHSPIIDPVGFRREILARQLAAERSLRPEDGLSFLDRGAYDGRAFCYATDCPEPDFLRVLPTGMYSLVFLCEAVPVWKDDGVRYEDLEFTETITPILEDVYTDTGATVVRVPFMPVQDRVNLVLSTLREFGMIQ